LFACFSQSPVCQFRRGPPALTTRVFRQLSGRPGYKLTDGLPFLHAFTSRSSEHSIGRTQTITLARSRPPAPRRLRAPRTRARRASRHRCAASPQAPLSSQAAPAARGRRRYPTNSLERGGGVSARAHACVALGRCVAFGRPKMSVWGHAGAGSPSSKVACISFVRALFWNLFDVSVSIFLFQTPSASPVCNTTHVPTLGTATRL
jgi:hypothetical protein